MTYGILSLSSGNILDSYRTSAAAFEAVANMVADEPAAISQVAVVEFDDDGAPHGVMEGEKLANQLGGVAYQAAV